MKKMKCFLRITMILVISLFLAISCKPDQEVDYTNPANLVGTAWKCYLQTDADNNVEYVTLKFTSKTDVEIWRKELGLEEIKDWTGSYSIDKNALTFDMGIVDGLLKGTIEGTIMSFFSKNTSTTLIFTKQ